jgi:hypothetical protein
MIITAKFPSTCHTCGKPIAAGEPIEWTKGSRDVRHASCVASTPRRTSSTARHPVYSSRPARPREAGLREPKTGEQLIHRDSDAYAIGDTIHASRIPGGGGEDGCYWTVVAAGSHRISEYEDDTREGDRRYDAIVRPSTDPEAAACASRIAAAQARKARVAELTTLLRASRVASETDARNQSVPRGSTVLWQDGRLAGSETWYQAPDGSVWYCRSSYDDGPAVWATTATVEQIAEAKALGLKAGVL